MSGFTFLCVLIFAALLAGLIYYSWPRPPLPYEKLQQVPRRGY